VWPELAHCARQNDGVATQTDGRPDSTTDESTGDDVLRQRNVPEAIRSLSTLAKPDYVHPTS
jgi:hypothetical protein